MCDHGFGLTLKEPDTRPTTLTRLTTTLYMLTLAEAPLMLPSHVFREVVRDGRPLSVTRDYRRNRANVSTVSGRIDRVLSVG